MQEAVESTVKAVQLCCKVPDIPALSYGIMILLIIIRAVFSILVKYAYLCWYPY